MYYVVISQDRDSERSDFFLIFFNLFYALRLNICYLPLRFQMGGKSERLVATKKQLLSLPRIHPLASRKSGPSTSLLLLSFK